MGLCVVKYEGDKCMEKGFTNCMKNYLEVKCTTSMTWFHLKSKLATGGLKNF